mgnify:CR=1 FL=1
MALSACAQKAEKISPAYVSPLTYQDYSCKQIAAEASRVSGRAAELAGVQDKQAKNDAVATGVALVLLWPAAFFIKGDKGTATELARLKGELETLEKVSIQKKCGIEFRSAPAPEETENA